MPQNPPSLHVEERPGELRISWGGRRSESRQNSVFMLVTALCWWLLALLGAMSAYASHGSRGDWLSVVALGLLGVPFLLLGLHERRHPRENVWIFNARERQLERNGRVVARFEEMRVLWVERFSYKGSSGYTLLLKVHHDRRMLDLRIHRECGGKIDLAPFWEAADVIVYYTGVRLGNAEDSST